MSVLYLILGVVLLALVIVDLFWTTLWVDGGSGPLSTRLTSSLWRGLRQLGGRRSWVLSLSGPIVLLMTLLMWVVLVWAGWVFLFAGGDGSIVDTREQEPVTWSGRIYFVAYTMFTMGNGDFSPKDGFWQIATSLTTASGMLIVTLAVSYVLSVLGAVTSKRTFAGSVLGLGKCSEEFVRSGWNGKDLRALDLPLNTFSSQVSRLADEHKAYPILHYYHSEKPERAAAVALATLDDALTLLRFAIPDHENNRVNAAVVASARASIESYLGTLNSAFIEPAERTPRPPELDKLRAAGIPTVSDDEFQEALAGLEERRRKLLGAVEADAWEWPPVRQ